MVEWGHPAEKILDYAENHGYELIIMGRRPFRTWSRIGNSTSVEVAQRSSIPVMIVQVPSSRNAVFRIKNTYVDLFLISV